MDCSCCSFPCLNAIYHSNVLAQECCYSFPLPSIINPNSMNPISNVCFFCSIPLFSPLVSASGRELQCAISCHLSAAFTWFLQQTEDLLQTLPKGFSDEQCQGRASNSRQTHWLGVMNDPQHKGKRLNQNSATKVIPPPTAPPNQQNNCNILGPNQNKWAQSQKLTNKIKF